MLELLTGTGLAMAAGLNAYIPLLAIGLSARFLDIVTLPHAWAWLENDWVLGLLAVLLVIEFLADKIPTVDTMNDWIQTVIRPTSGGLAFGSGASAEAVAVTDPAEFFSSNAWVPVAVGVALALGVHLAKMSVRPVLNFVTAGVAAPFVSIAEDAASVLLAVLAVLLPILLLLAVPALVVASWLGVRALQRRYPRGRVGIPVA